MRVYTVFCGETDMFGTTWIEAVMADSVEDAKVVGQRKCAEDWGFDIDAVSVIGVAEGDVKILFWDDEA